MLNDNQKRAKNTNFHINNTSKQYTAPQANNFRDIYINQSPTYYNQIRYENENKSPYIPVQYIQRQAPPGEFYQEGENFEKTMKNMKIKPDYFFNEFNSMKESVEGDKNFMQRSVNTFNNQIPNKLNQKYYILKSNNKGNENKSQNERKIITYKEYNHQSYQGDKYPNKFYKSLPLMKNYNYQNNIERGENSLKPVAQKICNIIIKGEVNNERNKKMRSGKKRKNPNFIKNIEIEENMARGAAIPDKNINFNINATKELKSPVNQNEDNNYDDDNEENEYEEIEEEKEEILPMSDERKIEEMSSEQRGTYEKGVIQRDPYYNEEYEEDDDLRDIEEKRNDVEEVEIEEGELDEIGEEGQYQMMDGEEEREIEEEGQEQIKDRHIRGQQIEQLEDDDVDGEDNSGRIIEIENEEESNRIHKRDIEELEDEEQHQAQVPNIINKIRNINAELKFQRGKDIKIEGIEDNNNGMEIDKDKINNDKKQEKDKIVLEINSESNVSLNKKENTPINESKKIQNLAPAKNNQKIYKKQILNIIKNKENNVDVIREEDQETETNVVNLELQKVQNFDQPKYKKRKIRNKNEKLNICKIKDNNFILEKIYNDPDIEIENVLIYQQTPEIIKNKKTKFLKLKIVKNKDGIFELIGIPSISICNENEFEIQQKYNKKIYKKSNYKKFRISKRMTHQYKSIQIINDAISIPKDSRFMLKGKPKRVPKKVRNVIRREIQYYYKAPISQKNTELSVGGNITNTINPSTSTNYDNNLNINNEIKKRSRYYSNKATNNDRNSSSSIASTNSNTNANNRPNFFSVYINSKSNRNILDKGEDNQKEYKRPKNRTYKTTTVVSSNLLKFDNKDNEPPKQENYQSIRRKYTNSKSNKNILLDQNENDKNNRHNIGSPQPSNEKAKDKIVKTESSSNMNKGRNHMLNIFSPQRNTETKKDENKNENNNLIGRNNIGVSKYEHFNKNYLIKSENNNIGKAQSYFLNKNNNTNKTEVPTSPVSKENNNNNYSTNNYYNNKSHTITIFSNKQEPKNVGRTYISSNKTNQRDKSNEQKTEEKNYSNVGRIYVSTTHNFRTGNNNNNNNNNTQNEDKKTNISNKNTIYVSTNLKKDKVEDEIEIRGNNKDIPNNNNAYYTSSFSSKKPETKQFFNNNKMYISSKVNSSNINTIKDNNKDNNKTEIKVNNINRIMVNSSANSPIIVKNIDNLENKLTPNNMNKIFNNVSISSSKDNYNKKTSEPSKVIKKEESNKFDKSNEKEKEKEKEKEILKTPKEEPILDKKNFENKSKTDKYIFNYGTSLTTSNFMNNAVEDKKEENKNIFDKYNIGGNSQLSDFSKNYLNSYMPFSRPELSDFSKQFLSSNYSLHSSIRPELSNITRVYLNSQANVFDNDKK